MKIALIDHNDSFTFNIVETLRSIKNCTVTVINYTALQADSLDQFHKIILSPGPYIPKHYQKTFDLIKTYYKTKPILGICLGHQAICSFFGGKLYQLKDIIHGNDAEIIIEKSSKIFNNVPKTTTVGLYHSWAVEEKNIPSTIEITAKTTNDTVMAIQHKDYPVYGIQFHPESFLTTYGKQMLQNFIDL